MSASRAPNSTIASPGASLVAAVLLIHSAMIVHADIYTCTAADGITSYQQTPCPGPVDERDGDAEDALIDERESDAARTPEARPRDPGLVTACKKRYRDEIDKIDAEMRDGFSPDERENYRERLRALSQQLSQCEYVSDDTTSPSPGSQPDGGDL